jgi:hypothetical protein
LALLEGSSSSSSFSSALAEVLEPPVKIVIYSKQSNGKDKQALGYLQRKVVKMSLPAL